MALDLRVGNKYRLTRKIGSGSFGDIYLGTPSCRNLGFARRGAAAWRDGGSLTTADGAAPHRPLCRGDLGREEAAVLHSTPLFDPSPPSHEKKWFTRKSE